PSPAPPPPAAERSRRRRRTLLVAGACVCALVGALITWNALSRQDSTSQGQPLGSPEAVAAGEDRAADLAGDRTEIAARQHVEGPQLFSYQFTEEDVLIADGQAPIISNQLLVTPAEEGDRSEERRVGEGGRRRREPSPTYTPQSQRPHG